MITKTFEHHPLAFTHTIHKEAFTPWLRTQVNASPWRLSICGEISQRQILIARNELYPTNQSMHIRYSHWLSLRGDGGE
jgi:hypothetical protein